MTKEELKKEAEESAEKFFGKPTDLVDLDNLRIFKNGYLDGAEPREKRIEELERENHLLGERCNQLLKDKGDLTDKIADIKANCDLAIEGRDIKIKELEKQVKDLEWQLQEVAKDNDYYQAENKRLEKKNAKLESDFRICEKNADTYYDQLTKAKEIIKKFSEFANNEIEYDPEHPQEHTDLWNKLCEQAKQFLKGEDIILEDAQAGNIPFDADKVFNKEMKAYPEEK